jgi:hypothetical protein
VERHRTGGMTAIAVLNMVVGGVGILNGLYLDLGAVAVMYELLREGVFSIPLGRLSFALLVLATGIVGVVAGIGLLRTHRWARPVSLVYAGLLILLSIGSYLTLPILATIGTYNLAELGAPGLTRLIIFSTINILIPVPYAVILCVVFCKSARKTAFAKDSLA